MRPRATSRNRRATLSEEPSNPYARYEHYLHLALSVFREADELVIETVNVILGERFCC